MDDVNRSLGPRHMPPEHGRRFLVLINASAGTVRTRGEAAVVSLVQGKLGSSAQVVMFHGDPAPHVHAVVADKTCSGVIAGGGDGTISTIANLLAGSNIPLGVLPLGTMNLFCKAAGMNMDLDTALDQLAASEPRRIDVGQVNGHHFLLHLSFGLQPRLVRLREALGYTSRMTKIVAGFRAFLSILAMQKTVGINVQGDGLQWRVRAPMVVISNNELGGPHAYAPKSLSDGVLGIYVISNLTYWRVLGLARDVLTGRWSTSNRIDAATARSLQVEKRSRFKSRRRSVTVSVDGEIMKLQSPLSIKICPAALILLSPAEQ